MVFALYLKINSLISLDPYEYGILFLNSLIDNK